MRKTAIKEAGVMRRYTRVSRRFEAVAVRAGLALGLAAALLLALTSNAHLHGLGPDPGDAPSVAASDAGVQGDAGCPLCAAPGQLRLSPPATSGAHVPVPSSSGALTRELASPPRPEPRLRPALPRAPPLSS